MTNKLNADLCIIGGGSGGFGAAVSLLRSKEKKIKVLLVEKGSVLGGHSTALGVNSWEPGIGGPGIHHELFARLASNPAHIGIGRTTHHYSPEEPWGMSEICSQLSYESTLRRSALGNDAWCRVHFEAFAMAEEMENMLRSSGSIDIMYHTAFIEAKTTGDRIVAVIVHSREDGCYYEIHAKAFIDCTGDILVARKAGCKADFGEDPVDRYQEPSAPEKPSAVVNGVSLIFRVTPAKREYVDPLPEWVMETDAPDWLNSNKYRAVSINKYPDGDLNMNILPVMEGQEFFNLDSKEQIKKCKARARLYWHWLQKEKGYSNYTFKEFAVGIGVRESYRLVGREILTEKDVRKGLLQQRSSETFIAFADHSLDTHGQKNIHIRLGGELKQPYGIPYGCLLTNEFSNLVVACRGASFSHIAASSCRLSRTMLALGEAAGAAASLAMEKQCDFSEVPIKSLRDKLGIPGFEEEIIRKWKL